MRAALLAGLALCLSAPLVEAKPAAKKGKEKRALPISFIGEQAPRFILRTLNPDVAGPRYLLRDHVGPDARYPKRRVLLDFAASWCVPCRDELAELKKLSKPMAKKGIGVAVVVIDKEKEGIDFMQALTTEELKLPWPVVSDRFQVLARRYNVGTLPLAVVIDEEGVVRHVQEGFSKTHFRRLRAALGLERK